MIDYRSVGTPPRRQRLIASAGLDADPVVWAYKKDKEKAPAAVELETANPVKVRTHVCLSLPPSLPPSPRFSGRVHALWIVQAGNTGAGGDNGIDHSNN
jgi:nucleoid-associated protein YgaU